ncbi:MAG: DHH family phosphoesterase [Anaerolineae bacterium]
MMRIANPAEMALAISKYQRILIVSHVDPDGDTVGSALGLAWALRALGREVVLACQDPIPDEVAFVPGVADYQRYATGGEEVVIAVDASDLRRMGDVYQSETMAALPLLVIDHHVSNNGFGTLNLIEDASSTAEIILKVIDALGISVDQTVATCLLTGVITDTQGFRTSSTTSDSLDVAQRMVRAGADIVDIANQAFNRRSLAMLSLWGRALAAAELRGGVVWTELPLAWLPDGHANGQMGSGLANLLNTVREASVAALFTEQGDGLIDVSLRAKPGHDVSRVATEFGGGGHAPAAGCQVPGELRVVREAILASLVRMVAASK